MGFLTPFCLFLFSLILLIQTASSQQRITVQQYQQPNQQHQSQQRQQQAQKVKAARSRQILTQQQILSQLFSVGDYDPQLRPPVREHAQHAGILVITSLYIDRVNWHGDVADVDLYLRQQWLDSRLQYDVDSREGIQDISLPKGKEIWKPDTFFVGAEEIASGDDLRSRVVVEPGGFVRSSEKRSVIVRAEHSGSYPLSNHRSFQLKLSSYNYPIEDVVYIWANSPPNILPVEVSEELLHSSSSSPQHYTFLDAVASDCVGNYTVGVYSCINARLQFKGCWGSGWVKWILPSMLLLVVSWLHFWIHGSWSVPRTVSAALPFFIFVTLLLLHPIGSSALMSWIFACTLFTFASLVEYFLVICYGIQRRVRYTNGLVRTNPVEPYYQHEPSHPDPNSPSPPLPEHHYIPAHTETYKASASNIHPNNSFDVVSRVAFPIAFLIFIVIYFLYYVVF